MNRVHIVGVDLQAERIMAYLAKTLASGTGWSLSEEPDPTADANLWMLYLTFPRDGWTATPSAAWFTHRETGNRAKLAAWDRVASEVDLRLTSAPMYLDDLLRHGPAALVTPPVDRERFRPAAGAERRSHLLHPARLPVVGTSGWVYPGGRKGEAMLAQLATDLADHAEVIAAGQGWPVPTTLVPSSDLPAWYRSIDLYVCTSTVEGIPCGPLEALSAGIPVVIPRGVGLLDTLPYQDGIYRYDAGDYDALRFAVKLAMTHWYEGTPAEPETVRAATERFTAEAWCADWQAAVAALLTPDVASAGRSGLDPLAPLPAPATVAPATVPDWRGRAFVYMVSYGEPARVCAERAIASIRQHMPGLPVAVAAESPLSDQDVWINEADADMGARSVKTRMWDLAPATHDLILYLDADVQLLGPIDSIFQILADGWDVVACPDAMSYAEASRMRRRDNGDECDETFALWGTDQFLQVGGGVFGFRRSPATESLLRAWHSHWQEFGKRDQASLDRALWHHPVRLWVLADEFNLSVRYFEVQAGRTAISHHQTEARRWRGILPGRLDDPATRREWEQKYLGYHPEPPAGLVAAR